MKKNYLYFPLAIIILVFATFFYLDSSKDVVADDLEFDEQTATVRAIKSNLSSVVSIAVYEKEDYTTIDSPSGEPGSTKREVQQGKGTGFVISEDGYIVTNKHVVNAAEDVTAKYSITMNSGKEFEAVLVGKDPFNDLAVLKIDSSEDLKPVVLGKSSELDLGMTVIAIGNSLGRYKNSVTKGVISGLNRDLTSVEKGLNEVIQTDAEINLGNSGGPLINLRGEVIGINVAKDKSGSSIGFAIPIDDAKVVIDGIRNHQRIVRPIMGVRYMDLDKRISELNDLTRESGAWLRSVIENSPARIAGILPGDIIFEVNAVEVTKENPLSNIVQQYKPGDRIGVKIQRGDKVLIKIVTLGEYSDIE